MPDRNHDTIGHTVERPPLTTRKFMQVRDVVTYVIAPLALGGMAYNALVAPPGIGANPIRFQAGLLCLALVVYVRRCMKAFASETTHPREVRDFLIRSSLVWGVMLMCFTGIYRSFGLISTSSGAGPSELSRDAATCAYFAVITWTTVGYGDLVPSAGARPYAALEAMVGYLFMAFFVATLIQTASAAKRSNPPA